MRNLHNMAFAMAIMSFGTVATAGSLDPIVEPVVIVEDTSANSGGGQALVIALAILLAVPLIND